MISVTILTKNSEKHLEKVLAALKSFNEVVIFDNGSTDNTLAIAEKFPNVKIHKGKFEGFGKTHNKASSLAKNEWILSIDSDEVVTPEMVEEIDKLDKNQYCVYSFPRHNYYNGKFIKWCGWYPDRQIKLYNRSMTRYNDADVHETVRSEHMRHIKLKAPLLHYSYSNVSDFIIKMQLYSDLFAAQNKGKVSSSPFKAYTHGLFAFLKSYILKRGFMGGYEGFLISCYNAHTAFYKYMKLYEANKSDVQKEGQ